LNRHPERRASPRYPVALPADIHIPGQFPRRGLVTELGPGGALLKREGLPATLGRGARFAIDLGIPPDNPDGRFRIPVAVTGRTRSAVSLFFLEAPAAFIRALGRYLDRLASARARRAHEGEAVG
jgi:hypothetical protein